MSKDLFIGLGVGLGVLLLLKHQQAASPYPQGVPAYRPPSPAPYPSNDAGFRDSLEKGGVALCVSQGWGDANECRLAADKLGVVLDKAGEVLTSAGSAVYDALGCGDHWYC